MQVFTKENFEAQVLNVEGPVLVDFSATWCGPCKMLAPVLEGLEKEYEGRVVFGKVDIDESSQIAMDYQVVSVPTVILFENGVEVRRNVGFCQAEEMQAFIG